MSLLPASTPPRSRGSQGFTLIELVLGLTLLAMLTTTVFSIVRVSMDNALLTQQIQKENDEVTRFVSLCRQGFQSLPATAVLTLKITDTSQPVKQELTLSGAPDAFSFGLNPMSYKDTILTLRPDYAITEQAGTGQSLYYMGLSREDLIPTDPNQGPLIAQTSGTDVSAPDDQGRYWMPLFTNVVSLTWRFYKSSDDTWVEEWDSVDLPQLIEMNLLLHERTLPMRVVFALPTVKLAGANPALAPKTGTSSTNQGGGNSGNNTGGGNNNSGGGNNGRDSGRGRGDGGDRGGRGDRGRGDGGGQEGPGGRGPGGPGGRGPGGPGGQGQPQGGGGRTGGGGQNGGSGAQPGGGGGGFNGAPSGGGSR